MSSLALLSLALLVQCCFCQSIEQSVLGTDRNAFAAHSPDSAPEVIHLEKNATLVHQHASVTAADAAAELPQRSHILSHNLCVPAGAGSLPHVMVSAAECLVIIRAHANDSAGVLRHDEVGNLPMQIEMEEITETAARAFRTLQCNSEGCADCS